MNDMIDCFFIGHNEMDFPEYEKEVRKMGVHSGAYRDLSLNFLRYNDKVYSASDIFNLFYLANNKPGNDDGPLNLGDSFSAAIAYLGTYLDRRELSFDYVNSFQQQKEELTQKLRKENIHTIAVITTLYVSVFPILEIMDFIRKNNRTARVVIGGPFVATQCRTLSPESLEYLFKSIDADFYVNSSQGEATLVNIINAVKNNGQLEKINNIYYKSSNGYGATPLLEEDNDLSENMVNWDLFSTQVGKYSSVRTSISCPFSCSFCGFPQHAGRYRTAAVAAVEEELKSLAGIKSLRSINFIDDTFNVPVKRFKEILRAMIRNKLNLRWSSHFRCQFADRESLDLMKESGCEGVFLGIESGSESILKNMNKSATVEQYLKGIALLKEYDILTYGSFIIGFPGETEETVQETIRFIKDAGLDFYRAQLWYCEPITPIWKQKEKWQIRGESFEWSHATMDSKRACDLIDEIFLSIDNPMWVPQYDFECDGLFRLIHKGFTREEVKNFLGSFNNAVREKLVTPSQKEMSCDAALQLKSVCCRGKSLDQSQEDDNTGIDRSLVTFDF